MYGSNQYGYTQYGSTGHVTAALTETFTDTVTISDDPIDAIKIVSVKLFNDTLTLAEEIFRIDVRILLDDISISSDTLLRNTGKFLSDEFSLIDTIVKNITRIVSDTFTFVEDLFKGKAIENTDQIDLTDTIGQIISLHKEYNEQIDTSDTLSSAKGRNVTDIFSISDTLKRYHNGLSGSWNKIAKSVSNLWRKQHKP